MEQHFWTRKGVCEKFGIHIRGWAVVERGNAFLDLLGNVWNLIDMCFFRSLMESFEHMENSALVIDGKSDSGRCLDMLYGGTETTQPADLFSGEKCGNIFILA